MSMHGYRERVTSTAGDGCLVQLLGVAAPFLLGAFFGWIGIVLGVMLFFALFVKGARMARKSRCSCCKNPLPSDVIRICPVCKAELS